MITDSLGVGTGELALATELMRLDSTEACLSDAGWAIDDTVFEPFRADIDDLKENIEPSDVFDGDVFDGYIEQIKSGSGELQVSPLWSETGFPEQYQTCEDTAVSEVPDPAGAVLGVIINANDEIDKWVSADPTVVEADRILKDCLQQLGFTTESVNDQRNAATEQGSQIVNDFQGGSLTADQALDQLGVLRADAERVDALAAPCYKDHAAVVENAVDAAQQRYLTENPGFLDGVLEQNRAAAKQLRDFMEARR